MYQQRGFTFIELMASLSIVGILMGLAWPSLSEFAERNRVAAAHNLLITGIAQARASAVNFGKQAVVCPSEDGRGCRPGGQWQGGWIVFVDHNGNGELDGVDTLVRFQSGGVASLRVQSGASRPKIRFLANGRSAGTNLSIRICGADSKVRSAIVLNTGGRARQAQPAELRGMSDCA